MSAVVIFAIGSAVVADVAESIARAGIAIEVGIKNSEGPIFLPGGLPVAEADAIKVGWTKFPFLVPLFKPRNRAIAARQAKLLGFANPFVLVDPTSVLARTTRLGSGIYINGGVIIGAETEVRDWAFINRGVNIGHHCSIEDFASIGPGVSMAGYVTIGRGATIGVGATILPGISVGENSIVGAGSVVTRDVPAQTLVWGNPARFVRNVSSEEMAAIEPDD